MKTAEELYQEAISFQQTQNYKRAFKRYIKAAKRGYAPAQAEAGRAYLNGIGTAQNYKLAVRWLTKAAEQRHPAAICNLAFCYSRGLGVQPNNKVALRLYERPVASRNRALLDDYEKYLKSFKEEETIQWLYEHIASLYGTEAAEDYRTLKQAELAEPGPSEALKKAIERMINGE